MADTKLTEVFRDPSGFIFTRDGQLYRQVNKQYQADYELLFGSGLYQELTERKLLIPHSEVNIKPADAARAYKVLQPERIPYISYAYEWSFSQLKDAALLTLDLQTRALKHGMWMKDANNSNIQFLNGRPILIDSLSFESYPEGLPWTAYRQFCQHFLAPLALMAYVDVRLNQLLRNWLDGVDLSLASRLLPWTTRLNSGLLLHIHAHAGAQRRYAGAAQPQAGQGKHGLTKTALLGLIDHLRSTVQGLK